MENSRSRLSAAIGAALLLGLTTAGCQIYRIDIQQGQDSAIEKADEISVGMTPGEVVNIMGTPLVVDKFRDNRWDYLHSLGVAGGDPVVKQRVTVIFEGGRVAEVIIVEAPLSEAGPTSEETETN